MRYIEREWKKGMQRRREEKTRADAFDKCKRRLNV
jgi:hypothetical protein